MRVFKLPASRQVAAACAFVVLLAALAALSGCAIHRAQSTSRDGAKRVATHWPVVVDTPYAGPIDLGRCGNDGFGKPTMKDLNVIDGITDDKGDFYVVVRNTTGLDVTGVRLELVYPDGAERPTKTGDPVLDVVNRTGGIRRAEGRDGYGDEYREWEFHQYSVFGAADSDNTLQLSIRFERLRVTTEDNGQKAHSREPVSAPMRFKLRIRWLAGTRPHSGRDGHGIPV